MVLIYSNYIKEGNINEIESSYNIEMIKIRKLYTYLFIFKGYKRKYNYSVKIHRKSFKTSNV